MGKKALAGIGICFGCLLLLLFVLFAYLSTDGVHRLIQRKINQAIPGAIVWEKGRFSLFGATVKLEGVVVTGAAKERLATVDRFSADLSFFRLLLGDLAFKAVVVEKPSAWLHVDGTGQLDIIEAFVESPDAEANESEAGLPLNIAVDHLELTGGFFLVERQDKGTEKGGERMALHRAMITVEDANLKTKRAQLSVDIKKGDLDVTGKSISFHDVSVAGNLNGDRVDALSFALFSATSALKGTGEIKDLFSTPLFDLTLAGKIALDEIQALFPDLPASTGPLILDLALKGPLDNPDVALKLDYEGGTIAGSPVDTMAFRCQLENKKLSIETFEARSGQTTFDMKGTYDVSSQELGLTAQLASPDLGVSFFQPEGKNVRGSLHLNGFVNGFLDRPEVELRLNGQGLGFQDMTFGDVVMDAALDASGALHVSSLRLQNQGSVLEGLGTVQVLDQNQRINERPSMDVNLSFRDVVLEHFIDNETFRGQANGSVTLTGKTTRLKGNVVIEGKNLGYEESGLGNLTAHVGLENGIVSLDKVQLKNADSELNVSGTVQALDPGSGELLEDPDLDVTVKSDAIYLQDFMEDVTGTLSVKCQIRGPVKEPRGELVLKGQGIYVVGQKIHTVDLTSRLDGDRVHVAPLIVKPVEGEQLLVKGWISRDKEYALEVISEGIDLSHIHGLQEILPLEGALSLDLKGEGSLEKPQGTGTAGLRNLRLDGRALQDLACNLSLKEQEARVSVDSDFDLEGLFRLDTKAFSLSARFEQMDLTPYLRLAKLEGIHGALTGKADLEGNVTAPNAIQGQLDFSQFDLFSGKTPLVSARTCQVSFRNQELLIPRVHVVLAETGHLTLEGKGNVDGPLGFKAEGRIPMPIIQSFTEHISETKGDMALSATVQGHSTKPNVNVVGEFKNIGFFVPSMAQRLHNLQGKIRATTKVIVLEDCRGNLDTGEFAVSGKIDLEKFQPSEVDLKAQVSSLPIRLPNTLDIMVDGKLDAQGTREASTVRGKVVLLEGTYYKDVELTLVEGDSYGRRKTLPVQQDMTEPFLRNMALDVVVTHQKPFVVDNNLALLTVKPDLRLYGTLNNPLMSGRAEVDTGIITYQKEDFTVTQGVFDFINPYRIEPTIDVKGEMKIRRWMIFLEVSGVPDNLKFILTSNPSETTEDLLSLLALGKTTGELIGDESGSGFSTTQMLSDVLGGAMGEDLKDATGLDEVKIGYTEGDDDDEEDGIDVSLGKKLSRRATVKYGVETKGAKTIQRVDVGYKLRENLSVSSFQNTEGQFGGELYRLEFR